MTNANANGIRYTNLLTGRKSVIAALLSVLICWNSIFFTFNREVYAAEITTDVVMGNSFTEDCVNWCIVGICIWLQCTIFGCEVETTLRVRHGAPDLVASVHNISGVTTWVDVTSVAESAAISFDIGGGDNTDENGGRHYDSLLKFKEVSLNGNPMSEVISSIDYFCETDVTPFFPYYTSEADQFVWRTGIPEQITHLLSFDNVGSQATPPLWSWSRVFPRHGFVNQEDDAHAAGVAAVRAASVVDDGSALRIVFPLETPSSVDSRSDTDRLAHNRPFQRLTPEPTDQCEVIGSDNSILWSNTVSDPLYLNAWNYWHRYECCMEGSGAVIASFSTGSCPGE